MEGEVLKGHLDMIVLSALTRGPAHGYAIIEEIRNRSGGNFDLPEGTIYPALHRLESAGLLKSEWTESDTGRRRRTRWHSRPAEPDLEPQRDRQDRAGDAA